MLASSVLHKKGAIMLPHQDDTLHQPLAVFKYLGVAGAVTALDGSEHLTNASLTHCAGSCTTCFLNGKCGIVARAHAVDI